MRLLYKPFQMVLSRVSRRISRRLFSTAWNTLGTGEPPTALSRQASWPSVLGASVLRAVSTSLADATTQRLGAKSFYWLTGVWPAKQQGRRRR